MSKQTGAPPLDLSRVPELLFRAVTFLMDSRPSAGKSPGAAGMSACATVGGVGWQAGQGLIGEDFEHLGAADPREFSLELAVRANLGRYIEDYGKIL